MLINMRGQSENQIENLLNNSFLKTYLTSQTITDIRFNGTHLIIKDNVKGNYQPDNQPSNDEVFQLGKRIADLQGKQFTSSDPILDTELAYYRVNFVHDSISPSGCTFAIRVSRPRLAIEDLSIMANENVNSLLNVLIKAKENLIIAGKTGAGKTEIQKSLVGFIPDDQIILLMEDTMDSHLKELYPNKDILSWRTLEEATRDKKITFSDLIKAGLRNNPDWMIVAETRGSEAYDMLESALTDHSIITTIHAKTALAIPSRLIKMIGQKYQTNEVLLGKDIVDTLRFGIYVTVDSTEHGIIRYIREIVEFRDFTENGVVGVPIYKVVKKRDQHTGIYHKQIITNPLSDDVLADLEYKELIHLLPECFIKKTDSFAIVS